MIYTCDHCGTDFEGQRKRRGSRAFCSRRCKDKARIGSPEQRAALLRCYYKRQYGLTIEEVAELRAEGCQICGRLDGTGRFGQLHIDHDHQSGKVRGVLCHGCNVSIGHFRDDPKLLLAAINYLTLDYTP